MRAMKPLVVVLAVAILGATGCSSTANKLSSSSWKFWKKDKPSSELASSTAPAYEPALPSASVQPGSSTVAGGTGYPYNAVAGSGTTNPFPAPGTYQPTATAPASTQTAAAYNSSTYNAAGSGTRHGYQQPAATQTAAAMTPQQGYYDAGSQYGSPATSAPASTSYGAATYTATAPAGYTQETPSSSYGGYGSTSTPSSAGSYASPTAGSYGNPTTSTTNPYVVPSSTPAIPAATSGAYPASVTPPATMPQMSTPSASAEIPQAGQLPQYSASASPVQSQSAYTPGQSDYTPGSGYTPPGVQPYSSPAPSYQSPQSPSTDPNYYPGASGSYRPGGTGTYPMPGTSSTTPAERSTDSSSPVMPASYTQEIGSAS